MHACICSGTVPELCCSGPWYRTYQRRIFWRLRSIRTHCFSCWMIRRCHCLSIKKGFCLLLLLLPKRLFWNCGLIHLPQLGLLGCHMYLLDIVLLACTTAKIHGTTRNAIELTLYQTFEILKCSLLVIPLILFCNVLFVSPPPPPCFFMARSQALL